MRRGVAGRGRPARSGRGDGAPRRGRHVVVLLGVLACVAGASLLCLMLAAPAAWSDESFLRGRFKGLSGTSKTAALGAEDLLGGTGPDGFPIGVGDAIDGVPDAALIALEAAAHGVEPFPRGPAPWGGGDDPSYGTCLDRECSILRGARMRQLGLPHLKPCRGSAVTALGDAGEPGGACAFNDGRCLYVLNTQPKEVSANWVEARFRDSGLFHYTDDLCSADIVLSNTRENITEAVVEQFMRKDQIIVNFMRWNTEKGGLNSRAALSSALANLPARTMLDAVQDNIWHTAFGTTLTFDPSTLHIIPETYMLDNAGDRVRLRTDTAAAAEVEGLSDDSVCSRNVEVPNGGQKTSMPLVFSNEQARDGLSNVIVWNLAQLRDVRCDIRTLGRLSHPGAERATQEDMRVLWPSPKPWVATAYLQPLLIPVRISTGETEWRPFSIQSIALIASSASPTVLHHDGYLHVGEFDARSRDISDPSTWLPRLSKSRRVDDLGTLDFSELSPVMREYFPDHPDPVAALRCLMDKAVAAAFAATHNDGSFSTNGFRDRHWWFTFEFMIDRNGRPYLLEANRRPVFENRLPHSKSTSIEWLSDFAQALVAVEGNRVAGGAQDWPLEGVKYSRPVLVDDSTELPALGSCTAPGAETELGSPSTSHIPEVTNGLAGADDQEPFPRGPVPWGYGNDPSYGACLNKACSDVSEDLLEALRLPRSLRPCKGSPVTQYGDSGERGYGCPFVDGRCFFVVDVPYAPGVWAYSVLKETGIFHIVDDLCSADVVFSKVMDNSTEAIVEQFMRKDQRIINWQRWNTESGGLGDRKEVTNAVVALSDKLRNRPDRGGYWDATGGVSLDFNPSELEIVMRGYDLSTETGGRAFLEDFAAVAGVHALSDNDVCREGATVSNPSEKLAQAFQLDNQESKSRLLIWSLGMLRDLRCDLLALIDVLAGTPGAGNTNLRVLKPDVGNLFRWRATPYIESLKHPVTLSSGEQEWRLFKLRSFAVVASSASPTVLVHDGFVRVSVADDRHRVVSRPKTVLPNFSINNRRPVFRSEDVGSVDFAAFEATLRSYFPDHPDPAAYVRCSVDRAVATAFAATAGDGTFETNGFADRHWWFAVDFIIDVRGRVILTEVLRSPAFSGKTMEYARHVSSEFLSDLAFSVVAMEDMRRVGATRHWPIQGLRHTRPVLLDGATGSPALHTCRIPKAKIPLGDADLSHVEPLDEEEMAERLDRIRSTSWRGNDLLEQLTGKVEPDE